MNHQIQYLKSKYGKKFCKLVEDRGDHLEWLGDGHDLYEAFCFQEKKRSEQMVPQYFSPIRRTTPHRTRQRGKASRSSAASGDGNSNTDDTDPERRKPLYDQAALADLLCVSKKTLQNQYSASPHTLPPAIAIPGARGPRWTPQAVQEWLDARPQHQPKPAPVAPKRKVGRPRIAALRSDGGVS